MSERQRNRLTLRDSWATTREKLQARLSKGWTDNEETMLHLLAVRLIDAARLVEREQR